MLTKIDKIKDIQTIFSKTIYMCSMSGGSENMDFRSKNLQHGYNTMVKKKVANHCNVALLWKRTAYVTSSLD